MRLFAGFPLRFLRDERGTTAIEYGLIAGAMAIAVVACIAAITPGVGGLLGGVAKAFPTIN